MGPKENGHKIAWVTLLKLIYAIISDVTLLKNIF